MPFIDYCGRALIGYFLLPVGGVKVPGHIGVKAASRPPL
jgi:hypothetical protein